MFFDSINHDDFELGFSLGVICLCLIVCFACIVYLMCQAACRGVLKELVTGIPSAPPEPAHEESARSIGDSWWQDQEALAIRVNQHSQIPAATVVTRRQCNLCDKPLGPLDRGHNHAACENEEQWWADGCPG